MTKDENPIGGYTSLTRSETPNSYTVTTATALNRVTDHTVERLSTEATRRVVVDPAGLVTETIIGADTSRTISSPDGTTINIKNKPDPRFSMQSPIADITTRTTSGLTSTTIHNRTAILSNPNDPLSLTTHTDQLTLNGRAYTSVYDRGLKTITTTTPANRVSYSLLNTDGRISEKRINGISPVNYTYNPNGRLSSVTQGARQYTFTYDTAGYLSGITNPLLLDTRFEYDLAGRLTRETLPDNRYVSYTYDPNGNLTSITPPGRPAHYFNYTPADQTDSYVPPDIGAGVIGTTYDYNLDKELTLITRPDGQAIAFGYDFAGRLSSIVSNDVISVHTGIQYSSTTGALASITTSTGNTLEYTYDGSLFTGVTWTGTINGSVGFTYNNDFNISSETINGIDTINFSYDNDGLLTNAGSLTISRDIQNGLITGTTLGSISTQNTYNGFGEISEEKALANGITFFTTNYTRDDLGRIIQKSETINGVVDTYAYGYDPAGRLTAISKNGSITASYTYDSNSNRISYTNFTGTISGSYDNQDRVAVYGSNSYIYTANGELKNKITTDGTTNYFYDALGNLLSVTLPDGRQIGYIVDGENRRIGKKVNGILTQGFLYENQLRPIAELDSTGNVVSRFVYGSKINVPDYMIRSGITYRIISDHLGSPRFVINIGNGVVAQEIVYDEFGNVLADTNPGFQPFGFAGGLYDIDTKLTRFGARDYDAETGRWTAKDPILFAGGDTNLYGYVQNDPVNFIDPYGLFTPHTIIGGAIGGTIAGGVAGGIVGGIAGAIDGGYTGGWTGALSGGLSGALSGGITGAVAGGIAGGLAGAGVFGGLGAIGDLGWGLDLGLGLGVGKTSGGLVGGIASALLGDLGNPSNIEGGTSCP